MKISARVHNADRSHRATVTSAGVTQNLAIPAKASGPGAGVNGGNCLLALATCYCNDIYREAARSGAAVLLRPWSDG